jgi:hypothetical protein
LVDGHLGKSAGRIDGVVVAEDEELGFGARVGGGPDDAEMIAAMFLGDSANKGFASEPKVSEKFAAEIGGSFFGAGRFVVDEEVEGFKHLGEARAQKLEKSFGKRGCGWHGELW